MARTCISDEKGDDQVMEMSLEGRMRKETMVYIFRLEIFTNLKILPSGFSCPKKLIDLSRNRTRKASTFSPNQRGREGDTELGLHTYRSPQR